MMRMQIDRPARLIADNWITPSPLVGSGHDARSSENGLLTIMYGSVERASRLDWLNAGRTLVDKTYISILWQAAALPSIGVSSHNMASDLDMFIRHQLQPVWTEIEHLTHDERHELAVTLLQQAADSVFGSGYQEQAASWLLFYLCPQLPVFPITAQLRCTLLGPTPCSDQPNDYASYHQACRQQFSRRLPHIHSAAPAAEYGNERDISIINLLLRGSDWWQRRCFIAGLLDEAGAPSER